MRIAYIVNHLGQTGVNNVVYDLVNVMKKHHHECVVFYMKDVETTIDFGCETRRLKSLWDKYDFNSFDVVHTHGLKPNLYTLFHKSKNKKTKHIATIHCYVFQDFMDLYGRLKGFVLSLLFLLSVLRHDKIVALSKDAMNYYLRWLPKKKMTFVYNTRILEKRELTNEEREELRTFKEKSILIGMNCVLLLRKGIDIMIKAMALLPENYKLFIVGSGKEEALFKNMAKEFQLQNRIYFAGFHTDAYRYLSEYDIYALPSRSEGFPLALLEAAVYKKAVVSSDLPIIKECFDDDELKIFQLPDENQLAKAIVSIDDEEQVGLKLEERYLKDYSPECFYENYLKVYNGES